MKKYTLFLFVLTLFITLLGFNTMSVRAQMFPDGCRSSAGFSSTTGQVCNVSTSIPTIQPFITGIAPSSGPIGTSVTITGSGFATTGNTINFGDWQMYNVSSSNGGTKITFIVPNVSFCYSGNDPVTCPHSISTDGLRVPSGTYHVGVDSYSGLGGSSNSLAFYVTASTSIPMPAPSCSHRFSITTGKALPCGCSLESGFSTTTGESCKETTTPPATTCINGFSTTIGLCGDSSNGTPGDALPLLSPSCQHGFNVVTGKALPCGCSFASGFSTTTGESCKEITTPPVTSCSHGFSLTTGKALPCGCNLESGFSSTDGRSCRVFSDGCTSYNGFSSTTGQSCSGLPVGENNSRMTTSSTPPSTNSPACTFTSTLRLGSTGTDVSCLQSLLGLVSDGKFGPRTLIVVKAFQANAGLVADGVVGPRSVSVLEVSN